MAARRAANTRAEKCELIPAGLAIDRQSNADYRARVFRAPVVDALLELISMVF